MELLLVNILAFVFTCQLTLDFLCEVALESSNWDFLLLLTNWLSIFSHLDHFVVEFTVDLALNCVVVN